MLLSSLKLLLFTPVLLAAGHSPNSFHESLTLHPLPDGKLSVLFEFTTYFTQTKSTSSIPQYHHSVTPPSLLLPLQTCNISEISISFVSGRWDQRRTSQSGPLHYLSGGGGGEVRGWVRNGNEGGSEEERWGAVTHALGGLFCAGLGPKDTGENVKTFGGIYPPHRGDPDENLTPFLSLLPSKGLSGLSALLAQPGIIFSWGFQSEGIEVIMPSDGHPEAHTIDPPTISVTKTIIDSQASDGTFQIKISNHENIMREAIYSEIWPWWVKGWMSEMAVWIEDEGPRYAERGQEIPAGVLTLLDLIGEHGGPEPETKSESSPSSWASPQTNVFRSNRARIYTPRILLDIPTPDFSMPYNVIIMSSTVMAVFFGLMHGGLTRRWGWVEVPEEPEEPREEVRVREEKD
ncbi:phosphatidylinositol glycan, class T [Cryptococcus deuterogattii 99/473]|uniref:Phosphatidylinositol glycan, class T n=1 Tax=Cryptococcus deuterogattii Ram5 TaxID=1296110 RepID=A0A0D0VAJ7_9TREE|nr:phosphatidylinositol glycan, class T [Cryptococcus deuterogattii LA55]KIR41825.1 phosphatidylinositol glycan, class T [Cryptococcus deuterogattii Ram5]KIR73350.1 phosphatidylinositol glycan, class T [Cryptococcus deuterogattii CA1014]KIR91685.1 phosphatidylinositol glycan, class T [Cryptococcus deuterogattii CBS 10090]KIR99106.1 phosphatidylinositol glycan, class T [Cryptococcus deuterogattii 2001/935-1]KIY60061.1 phosphatidylinositol glycan, class T [Cryptococcus deuterogattii 99/473]